MSVKIRVFLNAAKTRMHRGESAGDILASWSNKLTEEEQQELAAMLSQEGVS